MITDSATTGCGFDWFWRHPISQQSEGYRNIMEKMESWSRDRGETCIQRKIWRGHPVRGRGNGSVGGVGRGGEGAGQDSVVAR
jgi:hypothetical protein